MKLFQLTLATFLVGTAFGKIEDEVTCVFNKFRKEANIEPLKISTRLMDSAREIANASFTARETLFMLPGDKDVTERIKKFGYEPYRVYVLGGQGYKYPEAFAEAMIQRNPNVIRNPELKHVGYGKSRAFSNLDLGDSFGENEPTRDAEGC